MKVHAVPYDAQAITRALNTLLSSSQRLSPEHAISQVLALAELARESNGLIAAAEGWVQVVCGTPVGDFTPGLLAVQLRKRLLLARIAIPVVLAWQAPLLHVAHFNTRPELRPTRLDVLARHGFPVRRLLRRVDQSIRSRLARQGLVLPSRTSGDVYRAVYSELRYERAALVSTIDERLFSDTWLCTRYGTWLIDGAISSHQFAKLLAYNARLPLHLAEKILRGNLPADEITAELALVRLAEGGAR